jgi:hypothetical protein
MVRYLAETISHSEVRFYADEGVGAHSGAAVRLRVISHAGDGAAGCLSDNSRSRYIT